MYAPNHYYYNPTHSVPSGTNMSENVARSKSIYINKHLINGPKKVLVNPNFKGQVHINPNFKKPIVKTSKNIFVNPNLISSRLNVEPSTSKAPTTATTSIVHNRFTKINKPVVTISKIVPINSPIIKTKTKLVRRAQEVSSKVQNVTKMQKPLAIEAVNHIKPLSTYSNTKTIVKRHKLVKINHGVQRKIMKSKYKIDLRKVRPVVKLSESQKNNNPQIIRNKYKLTTLKDTVKVPINIQKSRFKLTRKYCMMQLNPQNAIIKNTKFKLIRSLSKSKKNSPQVQNQPKKSPTRKLIPKKLIAKKINRNRLKLKKNNIPCEIYSRTGFCKGIAKKRCTKTHDPNKVQICTRFLQGACRNEKCLLSHKVLPEKMPTCKFFLDGLCHKENCPYLHVKLGKDAPICLLFLQGFCPKGVDCDKRHQFLCPDFEKEGKCVKKYCRYPHGQVVRQYTFKLMKRIARNVRTVDKVHHIQKPSEIKDTGSELDENLDTKRYYECDPNESSNGENVLEDKSNDEDSKKEFKSIFDRPKLGTLPSFISF